ncbi:MAG TPA: hypothetical protein VJS44_01900 [Pyrinomonadaceae bacterium]|nr:hypothetical protein [Pyrinomonadaceae bacterium]
MDFINHFKILINVEYDTTLRNCRYIVVLILVLLAGVHPNTTAANQARKKQRTKATVKIPTVSFCDLTDHPERYLNRVVRVRASYIAWWESSYLYSDSCRDDYHKIHDAPACENPSDDECRKRADKIWSALSPKMRADKNNFAQRVSAVFVGRLKGPGAFGHLGAFRYEFRIMRVEKAELIPESAPWR